MTLSQGILPFKIEIVDDALDVTAYAGLPLVLEAMRSLLSKRFYRKLAKAIGYRSWRVLRRHVDATIIEAQKRFALKTYEGEIGYQPQMAIGARAGP